MNRELLGDLLEKLEDGLESGHSIRTARTEDFASDLADAKRGLVKESPENPASGDSDEVVPETPPESQTSSAANPGEPLAHSTPIEATPGYSIQPHEISAELHHLTRVMAIKYVLNQ